MNTPYYNYSFELFPNSMKLYLDMDKLQDKIYSAYFSDGQHLEIKSVFDLIDPSKNSVREEKYLLSIKAYNEICFGLATEIQEKIYANLICRCFGITKENIQLANVDNFNHFISSSLATLGCGSCAKDVKEIYDSSKKKMDAISVLSKNNLLTQVVDENKIQTLIEFWLKHVFRKNFNDKIHLEKIEYPHIFIHVENNSIKKEWIYTQQQKLEEYLNTSLAPLKFIVSIFFD